MISIEAAYSWMNGFLCRNKCLIILRHLPPFYEYLASNKRWISMWGFTIWSDVREEKKGGTFSIQMNSIGKVSRSKRLRLFIAVLCLETAASDFALSKASTWRSCGHILCFLSTLTMDEGNREVIRTNCLTQLIRPLHERQFHMTGLSGQIEEYQSFVSGTDPSDRPDGK